MASYGPIYVGEKQKTLLIPVRGIDLTGRTCTLYLGPVGNPTPAPTVSGQSATVVDSKTVSYALGGAEFPKPGRYNYEVHAAQGLQVLKARGQLDVLDAYPV